MYFSHDLFYQVFQEVATKDLTLPHDAWQVIESHLDIEDMESLGRATKDARPLEITRFHSREGVTFKPGELAAFLQNRPLEEVDLSNCGFRSEELRQLPPTLKRLTLRHISDEELKIVDRFTELTFDEIKVRKLFTANELINLLNSLNFQSPSL